MSERPDVFFTLIESPIGTLYAAATGEGICLLEFDGKERRKRQLEALARRYGSVTEGGNEHLTLLRRELDLYFSGRLRRFTVPLVLVGTEFEKQVWEALCRIPYGGTRTYGDLARELESPDGFRAVGRANGRNPVSIVVPCHRVVGAGGKLTGYGGGLWRKAHLLALESGQPGLPAAR
jgi:AraC family transcriptional regulator, regulatory protein of adaptative response / methylated-DNA-[protein]-cysteine methyltransferase